jgi:hypothetical protein
LNAIEFDLDQIDSGIVQKLRGVCAALARLNHWAFDFEIVEASGEGLPARPTISQQINALYESVIGKPRCGQIEL